MKTLMKTIWSVAAVRRDFKRITFKGSLTLGDSKMASYPNWDIDIEDLLTPEQLSATALWVFSVILPVLTAFGLAGNCFNLAVLTLVNWFSLAMRIISNK